MTPGRCDRCAKRTDQERFMYPYNAIWLFFCQKCYEAVVEGAPLHLPRLEQGQLNLPANRKEGCFEPR